MNRTSKIEYLGELRCVSTHHYSGSLIETDAPLDNQGKAERFSPTDLVATALVNCMFTIMGIAARQENLALEGMWAEVQKHMYTNPRRIGEIHINLYFPAASQLSKDQSERLIRAAKSCPVFHSLHPDIKIELHWENEK